MITIVDYETGNLESIANMIRKVGGESIISGDREVIRSATKLILPGVGHFDYGMRNLRASGLDAVLNERVLETKIPILGICLGVQLFMKGSDEGEEPGLGWMDGYTKEFDKVKIPVTLKIPNMGWSEIRIGSKSRLLEDLENPRFYFVHSYHLAPKRRENIIAYSEYGYEFAAGVEEGNIVGVQFHPEKSHRFGMQVIKNFMNKY